MLAALLLVAAGIGWLAMTNRLRPDVILQAVYDPIRLQPVFWKVQASPLSPAAEKALQPKDRFRECNLCPEMTVIPAGRFWMGRDGGFKAEAPRHEVEIPRHLAVSLGVIGIDQWDACHAHGVCFASTRLFRGTNDAATLSWHEIAGQYLRWLSQVTGKRYRLLSEAEWEYAMLGGNDGRIEPSQPHPFKLRKNGFGLDEVRGYEWVQDCWHDSYADKPAQLSATGGAWEGQCRERVIRTMKYDPNPGSLVEASPARSRMHFGSRQNFIRFRVARDMDR
jgi:formylglycine-generating enzyme required for sulfatase activity